LITFSLSSFVPLFFTASSLSLRLVHLGGTIIIWKSSRFSGQVIAQNSYAMSVEFVSSYSGAVWVLTNIYAPCTSKGKIEFLNWLHDFELPEGTDWLLVGDFNLIRRPSDRNKPGGIFRRCSCLIKSLVI
jgi:hypothetical protein